MRQPPSALLPALAAAALSALAGQAAPAVETAPDAPAALVLTLPPAADQGPFAPAEAPWRRARPTETAAAPLRGHVDEAGYDLPLPWGEASFEAFRASYQSPDGRRWLAAVMERARPWLSYVMERLRYYGLPEELAYLPVVESEYSPRALSKSGAAGIWQFMRNSTGSAMRVDDWVDERRDFMKSTDAALQKLAGNHDRLGDWNLALAAYNMGLGAISRAVAKAGTRDFWELREKGYLSKETSSYVPKFLAVASVLRYPGRHGLPLSWEPPVEWEDVELGRSVDLGLLASAAGLPLDALRAANAELRYAVTPPWKGYRLKVPAGAAEPVRAALADAGTKLLRYQLHTVRSGDSLSALSRAYGAPLSLIVDSNPGLVADRIKIGQVLVVPVVKEGALPPPPVVPDADVVFGGSYTVAKGDSLWGISLRFKVRPELLAEKNGLELTSVIREGTGLSVPIVIP